MRTYTFDTLDMLEKYWYEMYEICMHTPLGGSSALLGKEVVFEFMDKKPAMQATLQPKTSQEVRNLLTYMGVFGLWFVQVFAETKALIPT